MTTSGDGYLYASDELEAMSHAENYFRWIVAQWQPYLRGSVVEVGAGTGNFSTHVMAEPVDRLVLVEPAKNLFHQLQHRFGAHDRVELRRGVLDDWLDELKRSRVDAVLSVNVLEHIPEDVHVLRGMRDILVPGGAVLTVVPALPLLYGPTDRNFGHVRRYTKAGLGERLHAAGLTVVSLRYFNFIGALSWLVAGRVLRRHTLTARMVRVNDATLIPLAAWVERFVTPPFGQSLIAVACRH
jgi:SAM-dependent methyltransferase